LPQTGSMMVQVMMLLGLALVGTGTLLRKKH
jgi:Gram positive anchor.